LLVLCFLLFQCQKQVAYYGGPDTGAGMLPHPIETTVHGTILDETGQPSRGVAITISNKTAITDTRGYFRINDVQIDKNVGLITATKTGYYKAMRVISATSGTNQVLIKLLKKELAGTVTASAGGEASLQNGSKVSLPGNAVVVAASGAAFIGSVNIYATYIDPASLDFSTTIPGSLKATDKNGNRVVLQSFGMLAVELESTGGEKLQLKTGSLATLTTRISGQAGKAPATIPLWFVDEQTGLWKEEGKATKQGNNYVGEVKHFSFWNCDRPFDIANISMTIHTDAGKPLAYAGVKITAITNNDTTSSAFCYTDSIGQVAGMVPANQRLVVEVLDPCYSPVYSKDVPAIPINGNVDLGIINAPVITSMVTLNGTLNNCAATPVKHGYAIVYFNHIMQIAATDQNGKFTASFIICASTVATASIVGVDTASQTESNLVTVVVNGPVNEIPTINACIVSRQQYINYTLDGTGHQISTTPIDTMNIMSRRDSANNALYIAGQKTGGVNDFISFSINNFTGPGRFSLATLSVSGYGAVAIPQPISISISEGEYHSGEFGGQFTDSLNVVHNISATFKVRRN
jgi:hypothetical protein